MSRVHIGSRASKQLLQFFPAAPVCVAPISMGIGHSRALVGPPWWRKISLAPSSWQTARAMNYERLKVHPKCLLIFIDETGMRSLPTPTYPVFGFGGCAVPAFAAPDVLERPWREMKQRHFGDADVALHASDLRDLMPEQTEALGGFFRDHRFGRFAVTMCRDVCLSKGQSPIQAMRVALRDRWSELASRVVPTPVEVAFIFEASERGSPLIERYFGPTVVHVGAHRIPTHNGFIEKRFGLEALGSCRLHRTCHRWSSSLASPGQEGLPQGLQRRVSH